MKKVTGSVSTRMNGSRVTFEFEVDDDATEEEIEEYALDAMHEQIDWHFQVEDADE